MTASSYWIANLATALLKTKIVAFTTKHTAELENYADKVISTYFSAGNSGSWTFGLVMSTMMCFISKVFKINKKWLDLGINQKRREWETSRVMIRLGSDRINGVSSYWMANPANTLVNNVAAGSEVAGFWYHLREKVEGMSVYEPRYSKIRPFR